MNRKLLLGFIAIVFVAATASIAVRRERPLAFSEAQPLSAATEVGTAPMFTVSPTGGEAAAWVSAPDGGTDGRLYISIDGAAPVEIRDTLGPIEAHGESPPKIAYAPDGTLTALYVVAKVVPRRRFPLAALRFIRSTDNGRSWSEPATVTDDDVFGSHNFHALHTAADGSVYVAWLDGREGKSGAYITRSSDGGRTWEPNRRIAKGEACPCCRTALATASDGTVFAAWRMVLPGNIRDIVVARSTDKGHTWTEPQRVHADDWKFDGCPHAGPSIQVDDRNRLHVAWWTGLEKAAGVYYSRSDDGGKTFAQPIALGIAEFSRPAHVQLALGTNNRVIAAWDDGTKQTPQVVVRVSRDGGRTFAQAEPISAPEQSATFPVLAVSDRGVTIAWSEQSAEAAAHEAMNMPDMKDPNAKMGLHAVGDARVLVRRASLSD